MVDILAGISVLRRFYGKCYIQLIVVTLNVALAVKQLKDNNNHIICCADPLRSGSGFHVSTSGMAAFCSILISAVFRDIDYDNKNSLTHFLT